METLLGKALNDMASLVADKWYAGTGLVGLIIFMWVLLKGTPHDDILVGAIAIIMFGFGFAEVESRTFRQSIDRYRRFTITAPARKFTFSSIILYLMGFAGIAVAAIRAKQLY